MAHYTLIKRHGRLVITRTELSLKFLQEYGEPYALSNMDFETGDLLDNYDPEKNDGPAGPQFVHFSEEEIIRELDKKELWNISYRIRVESQKKSLRASIFLGVIGGSVEDTE